MKYGKRILCLFLCAALLLSLAGTAGAESAALPAFVPAQSKDDFSGLWGLSIYSSNSQTLPVDDPASFGVYFYYGPSFSVEIFSGYFTFTFAFADQLSDDGSLDGAAVLKDINSGQTAKVRVALRLCEDGRICVDMDDEKHYFQKLFSEPETVPAASMDELTGSWFITALISPAGCFYYSSAISEAIVSQDELQLTIGERVSRSTLSFDQAGGFAQSVDKNGDQGELHLCADGSLLFRQSSNLFYFRRDKDVTFATHTVEGPASVPLGDSVTYTAVDQKKDAGRTFAWSVEGEGVAIDPQSGVLTVQPDAPEGSPFTVTATPDDGGIPASLACETCRHFIDPEKTEMYTPDDGRGFSYPLLRDRELRYGDVDDGSGRDIYEGEACDEEQIFGISYTTEKTEYPPDPKAPDYRSAVSKLKSGYALSSFLSSIRNAKEKLIDVDGHNVYLMCCELQSVQGSLGLIVDIRENTMLNIHIIQYSTGEDAGSIPKFNLVDLEALARKITFDPDKAPVRRADGDLTVSMAEGSLHTASAGATLTFTAAFANPEAVKAEGLDQVQWSVKDPDTGAAAKGITISEEGVLAVDKKLKETRNVEVTAEATGFPGTKASWPLTVYPPVKKLTVEPADVTFYTGSEQAATVKVLSDQGFCPAGVTWTPAKKDIIEITDNLDGTAAIKPLKAGKTAVAVKEPGGKNAKLNVSVVDPVESVELTVKGNVKPGASVTVSAALQPKTAGNKNVEWSLDVGEDIATIDARGRVKISKAAASGTKITVTCKALGAPEPVTATTVIEIP